MMDEYLHRDDQGIMILDGHRQGGDRRVPNKSRPHQNFDRYGRGNWQVWARREPGERRTGPVYSLTDIFLEGLSSFIIGVCLILTGVWLLITGLTFLPVIGIYAGIGVITIGTGFFVQAFRSRWPSL